MKNLAVTALATVIGETPWIKKLPEYDKSLLTPKQGWGAYWEPYAIRKIIPHRELTSAGVRIGVEKSGFGRELKLQTTPFIFLKYWDFKPKPEDKYYLFEDLLK